MLKADGTDTDAYVEIDLGSDQTDTWVTSTLSAPTDAATLWASALSGIFAATWSAGHGEIVDSLSFQPDLQWTSSVGSFDVPAFVGATHYVVEMGRNADGTTSLYIDNALIGTNPMFDATGIRFVRFGMDLGDAGASADPSQLAYVGAVKVGTSRHASNLFAADFSSGNLDDWTTTSGAVSVVNDPFSPPVTGSVSWPITVTFSVRGDAFSLIPTTPGTLTLTPSSDGTLTLVPT